MTSPLQGRVALVTGSTQGIGLATLRALAGAGCDVMMHGLVGNASAIEAERASVQNTTGVRVGFHGADLSSGPEVDALFRTTGALLGPVDILVNNAVTRHRSLIEAMPMERWEQALAVNLTAPFRLTQLALPGMKSRKWGRIVNVTSRFAFAGTAERVDYVATKHALTGLSRSTAIEAAPFGITCNIVCPGAILTPHADGTIRERMEALGQDREEAERTFLANRGPLGRFISPESVAALILFLCGPDAAEMTGSPVIIDGGWSAL
jgi:3-hydroxybutyrate dehydrogenase